MELLKKDYEFKCGLKAYQQEATYKSDKLLISLLKKINLESIQDAKNMKITDLITLILDADLLLQVLGIILQLEDKTVTANWENLTREEIIKVFNDFFILSPSLSKLLGIGSSELASQSE